MVGMVSLSHLQRVVERCIDVWGVASISDFRTPPRCSINQTLLYIDPQFIMAVVQMQEVLFGLASLVLLPPLISPIAYSADIPLLSSS